MLGRLAACAAFSLLVSGCAMWAFGDNMTGGFGDGTRTSSAVPVEDNGAFIDLAAGGDSSEAHGCRIRVDRTLWCWGGDDFGQIGNGAAFGDVLDPLQIGTDTNWADVDLGAIHSCSTRTDGSLWCWGGNFAGSVGDGTTTQRNSPVQAGTDTDWSSVSAGLAYTCAVKTDGTLWCWGQNLSGALGIGTTQNESVPMQVGTDDIWQQVSAGAAVTCALKTTGTMWCWGRNDGGSVGDGTTTDRHSPTQVGTNTDWAEVVTGSHSCARRTTGTLWCWGRNNDGSVGDGTTTDRTAPVQIGDGDNWWRLAAGDFHTCGLRRAASTSQLWCWGDNDGGENGGQVGNDNQFDDQLTPAQVGSGQNWILVSAGSMQTLAIAS